MTERRGIHPTAARVVVTRLERPTQSPAQNRIAGLLLRCFADELQRQAPFVSAWAEIRLRKRRNVGRRSEEPCVPRNATHQIGLFVVDESRNSSAPSIFFRRRDGRTLRQARPKAERTREGATNERAQRSAGGAFDRDAKSNEAEIAVDDTLARQCHQVGTECETLDVLVEDRAIV